jgi:hypothetical protein
MTSHVLICLTKTEHGALHLPELTNMDKFLNFSNVLDFRTYNFDDIPYGHTTNATHLAQHQQHDYNTLSPGDRIHFSYIGGLAINLIHRIGNMFSKMKEDAAMISSHSHEHTYTSKFGQS